MPFLKRKIENCETEEKEKEEEKEEEKENDSSTNQKNKKSKNENIIENIIENMCVICRDSVKVINNVKTSCNHTFCLSCLLEHLKVNNSCPCCRSSIETIRTNNFKQLSINDVSNLTQLNLDQNQNYLNYTIEKIKTHFIFSLFNNENGTGNNNIHFQNELLNITNLEIFNKNIKLHILQELIELSAQISINNTANLIDWINQ